MSAPFTNDKRRGRPPKSIAEPPAIAERVDASFVQGELPDLKKMSDIAIHKIAGHIDIAPGGQKWAIAYRDAGSILMHRYAMTGLDYSLLNLFGWLLSSSAIHFGEPPKRGDIVFLEANGYMYDAAIVESVDLVIEQQSFDNVPVWMQDVYRSNTRGQKKQYRIKIIGSDEIITSWYAIARMY